MNKILQPFLIIFVIFFAFLGYYLSPKKISSIDNNTILVDTVDKRELSENQIPTSWKSIWLGTVFPPLPDGVVKNSGGTVGDARYSKYALSDVTTSSGRELWLESIAIGIGGQPIFTVTDSMSFIYSKEDTTLVWGLCGKDNLFSPNAEVDIDNSIVAFVNGYNLSLTGSAVATQAWKVNTMTGKFELISPSEIICITETSPDYID